MENNSQSERGLLRDSASNAPNVSSASGTQSSFNIPSNSQASARFCQCTNPTTDQLKSLLSDLQQTHISTRAKMLNILRWTNPDLYLQEINFVFTKYLSHLLSSGHPIDGKDMVRFCMDVVRILMGQIYYRLDQPEPSLLEIVGIEPPPIDASSIVQNNETAATVSTFMQQDNPQSGQLVVGPSENEQIQIHRLREGQFTGVPVVSEPQPTSSAAASVSKANKDSKCPRFKIHRNEVKNIFYLLPLNDEQETPNSSEGTSSAAVAVSEATGDSESQQCTIYFDPEKKQFVIVYPNNEQDTPISSEAPTSAALNTELSNLTLDTNNATDGNEDTNGLLDEAPLPPAENLTASESPNRSVQQAELVPPQPNLLTDTDVNIDEARVSTVVTDSGAVSLSLSCPNCGHLIELCSDDASENLP